MLQRNKEVFKNKNKNCETKAVREESRISRLGKESQLEFLETKNNKNSNIGYK